MEHQRRSQEMAGRTKTIEHAGWCLKKQLTLLQEGISGNEQADKLTIDGQKAFRMLPHQNHTDHSLNK